MMMEWSVAIATFENPPSYPEHGLGLSYMEKSSLATATADIDYDIPAVQCETPSHAPKGRIIAYDVLPPASHPAAVRGIVTTTKMIHTSSIVASSSFTYYTALASVQRLSPYWVSPPLSYDAEPPFLPASDAACRSPPRRSASD